MSTLGFRVNTVPCNEDCSLASGAVASAAQHKYSSSDKEAGPPSASMGSRRGAAEAARVRRQNFERILAAVADSEIDTSAVARLLGVSPQASRKYVFTLREVGVVVPVLPPEPSLTYSRPSYRLAVPIDAARELLTTISTVAEHRRQRLALVHSQRDLFDDKRGSGQQGNVLSQHTQVPRRQVKHFVARDPLVAALFGPSVHPGRSAR